jgi:hypothetical protein
MMDSDSPVPQDDACDNVLGRDSPRGLVHVQVSLLIRSLCPAGLLVSVGGRRPL